MVTLKEFVKETLSQISEAVSEFSAEHAGTGASANPPLEDGEASALAITVTAYSKEDGRKSTVLPIDFDVAITAEDNLSVSGGGGIKVMSFLKAEAGVETETLASSVSRVKFRIPMRLPDTGEKRARWSETLPPIKGGGVADRRAGY